MPEIAKMLGVEMGEEFYIVNKIGSRASDLCGTETKYSLCDNKLQGDNLGSVDGAWLLLSLINGSRFIVKLPFKPQRGEKYWVWRKDFYNAKNVFVAQWIFWGGDITDRMFYMLGNCYRTEQECLADTAMKARVENMERCKW